MATILNKTKPSVKRRSEPDQSQLRRDRLTGIVVLIVLGALIGFLMWLASLGGSLPPEMNDWPTMM